jgi:hypothetical protein
VFGPLNFTKYKEIGVKLAKELWYELLPKSEGTSPDGKVNILWNQQVKSDRQSLSINRIT